MIRSLQVIILFFLLGILSTYIPKLKAHMAM